METGKMPEAKRSPAPWATLAASPACNAAVIGAELIDANAEHRQATQGHRAYRRNQLIRIVLEAIAI